VAVTVAVRVAVTVAVRVAVTNCVFSVCCHGAGYCPPLIFLKL
jgi:hypothetical protein